MVIRSVATRRQLIFSALAIVVAVGLYFLLKPFHQHQSQGGKPEDKETMFLACSKLLNGPDFKGSYLHN